MKKNKEMQFKIEWCDLCETNMVICPKCGNNCCNAGYGKMDKDGKPLKWNDPKEGVPCDICPLAYQFQYLYWKFEKNSCICEVGSCRCDYEKDKNGATKLPMKLDVNPKCPVHGKNKQKPNPKCPVHGAVDK